MTATATDANAPATNGAETPQINHTEVAIMFVQEYYTFMNKEPQRLHCFYSKDSTMVHGVEGESTNPHHGQQAIHSKIMELDFQDCKVRVKNIDSLSSLNGGIIIQVIGEMSNKGAPSQKFLQTFFLAEQPKGYYVLNDIFRFIEDDAYVGEYEEEYQEEATQEAEPEVQTVVPASEPVAEEPAPAQAAPAPEAVAETVPEPVKEAQEAAAAPAPAATEEKKADKKADKKGGDKKADKKADKKEENKEAKKEVKKEEDAEKTAVATAIPEAPVDIPAPAPAEPPKPKTWANLAANNSGQWGAHASTTKGASVTVTSTTSQPTPKPASQQQQPSQSRPHREYHSIYVKNVTEKMTLDQLKEAFSQFGVVKHLELTAKKNCAFVDFTTADAVQAALKQNTVKVGNEIVLAEERRRNSGPQGSGGRTFHHQNGANGHVNGHRYDAKQGSGPQGAGRGGRGGSARGGPGDRKPIHRQDKSVSAAAK
ncbi:hypothetical protein BGW41_005179 [Actinomortierella wolfii]|nr:hypothetical protein BGW41_005179 [Actinomortierella wolfii]